MKVLIITQKVNAADDVLGFFQYWLWEFWHKKEVEKPITVICLERGVHDFPEEDFRILSLGKERKRSRILYLWLFFKLIWSERNHYDHVFVHMNPVYVVLGGIFWRWQGKRIGLWYVHRNVDLKLRIAEKLAHVIWSTTPDAFRLKSKKVNFIGHGVNFRQFPRKENHINHIFTILHVGRITPIKNIKILIETARILKKRGRDFKIFLLGPTMIPSDETYKKELEMLIERYGLQATVQFLGKVAFSNVAWDYQRADVSVNLTPTGGMDKAVLESIASGTVALSTNRAFEGLFGDCAGHLFCNEEDPEDTANKIMAVMDMRPTQRKEIEDYLYERARARFDLDTLIGHIIGDFKSA